MAIFGYGRVSTQEQTGQNQRLEIERAGYALDYWFADEGVSGAILAAQRPQFREMLSKMRKGEVLVVTKIDRLGRDAIDIQQTVKALKAHGIKVHVTQLGGTDLTSTAGKLMLSMLAAFAVMERDLNIERTQAGLARAKAAGTKLGRPSKTSEKQRAAICAALAEGESVSALARQYRISRANVISIRARALIAQSAASGARHARRSERSERRRVNAKTA
jgi:DNA invertase Pin-like site-specific DNA recombinase